MAKVLLLAEDSENLILNKLILERHGYEHLTASTPEDALFHLQNSDVDVLYIVELYWSQFDGVEFYRQLKTDPELCGIPVIIYTPRVLSDISPNPTDYGDTVFVMPLEIGKLVAKVKELTDKRDE